MKVLVSRSAGIAALCLSVFGMLSCARDQQLIGISVSPGVENFGGPDPSLSVNLTAYGRYIHPQVTKNITDKVTWTTNTPGVATVTSNGVLSPQGTDCGNSIITATVQTNNSVGNRSSTGAIISGTMTANVACSGSTGSAGGSGGSSNLTVQFSESGFGTVASNPAGLGCTANCTVPFPTGDIITLTATADTGHSFVSWTGCDASQGQTCTLTLNSDRTIAVTFN